MPDTPTPAAEAVEVARIEPPIPPEPEGFIALYWREEGDTPDTQYWDATAVMKDAADAKDIALDFSDHIRILAIRPTRPQAEAVPTRHTIKPDGSCVTGCEGCEIDRKAPPPATGDAATLTRAAASYAASAQHPNAGIEDKILAETMQAAAEKATGDAERKLSPLAYEQFAEESARIPVNVGAYAAPPPMPSKLDIKLTVFKYMADPEYPTTRSIIDEDATAEEILKLLNPPAEVAERPFVHADPLLNYGPTKAIAEALRRDAEVAAAEGAVIDAAEKWEEWIDHHGIALLEPAEAMLIRAVEALHLARQSQPNKETR